MLTYSGSLHEQNRLVETTSLRVITFVLIMGFFHCVCEIHAYMLIIYVMCKNVVLNKHPGVILVSDNEHLSTNCHSYMIVLAYQMSQKAIYGLVLMPAILDFFLWLY